MPEHHGRRSRQVGFPDPWGHEKREGRLRSRVCGGSSEALQGRDERVEEIAEHPLDERRRCVKDATERADAKHI